MTANITDRTRVTCTIACSGASANNAVTSAALRTALGLGPTEPCVIGSVDGLYNQFVVTVTLGTATSWSLGLDFVGDGTYTTIASGLTTGGVCFGLLPGSVIPAGTSSAIGSCRPYAFRVVLNAADATSTINIIAFQTTAKQNLTAADVSSVNTAVAAVSTAVDLVASDVDDVLTAVNNIDTSGIAGIDTKIGTSTASNTVFGVLDKLNGFVLGYATVTSNGTTGNAICSGLIGDDFYTGEICSFFDVSKGKACSRTIASFSTGSGQLSLSPALPFASAVGDMVVILARSRP